MQPVHGGTVELATRTSYYLESDSQLGLIKDLVGDKIHPYAIISHTLC